MEEVENGTSVELVSDVRAAAILNRSDVEAQIDAAHKYPRSIKAFLTEGKQMVTFTRQVASSCIFALPRGGKSIPGPSVRLAEIAASAYTNLHVGARVVGAEEKEIVAQGACWDVQKNVRVAIEVRRRITNSRGERFKDDMITMTGNAAASIGLRNAVFRVIPRVYIQRLYEDAREVSVGNAQTLVARRTELVEELTKSGVPRERIFAKLGRAGIVDITLEDLELLIGLQTAIVSGAGQIDDLFPEVGGVSKPAKGTHADLDAALQQKAPAQQVQT